MAKLELGPLQDDKPVKISVELPAALHRDLLAYAEILESGKSVEPVERFIGTDWGFAKLRHGSRSRSQPAGSVPPKAG